jgi:hypothetical protein
MNRRRESGQASVELVATIPILLIALLALAQLVLAGYALWSAGTAARAGARASYVGGQAAPAARSALPSFLRSGARIGGGDDVEVRVRVPALIPGVPTVPVSASAGLSAGESGGG